MEPITRHDGRIYYGGCECVDVDEAYSRFRLDYHESLGRDASGRLDRLGQRTERIHGFGFEFSQPTGDGGGKYEGLRKCDYCLLALVGIHYFRIFGVEDVPPEVTDEEFEDWFDWAFSKDSTALRRVGVKQKVGRTSKRLKTRYR